MTRLWRRYGPVALVVAVLYALTYAFPLEGSNGLNPQPGRFRYAITPPKPPGSPGQTVGGYRCGRGLRQVPWSKYAPYCEPAWHGYNGGATAPGVTATTITVTYREAMTPAEKALLSLVSPQVVGSNASVIQTMQTYIDLFNKTFELYGRKVVLKPFAGKGDFLAEFQGKDLAQAQADAVEAKQLGAFADVSILSSTPEYDEALAEEKIIAIGAIAMPQSWFESLAPYEYSPVFDCTKGAVTAALVIGRSMADLPAIYAGDPQMRREIRRFGIIYPEDPRYASCAKQAIDYLLVHFAVRPAAVNSYDLNFATIGTQATEIVSKMKAAGVTSVLCACDPVSPLLLAQAANRQRYYPEWFSFSFGDLFGRLPPQNQWAHAISGGFPTKAKRLQEAYEAYKIENPDGEPNPQYGFIYAPLLLLFDALQAAGPYLTPETFMKGFQSLPVSLPGGDMGRWSFGPGVFDPPSSFQIIHWSPDAISAQDGARGTWLPCNHGYEYSDFTGKGLYGAPDLPIHRQLECGPDTS